MYKISTTKKQAGFMPFYKLKCEYKKAADKNS